MAFIAEGTPVHKLPQSMRDAFIFEDDSSPHTSLEYHVVPEAMRAAFVLDEGCLQEATDNSSPQRLEDSSSRCSANDHAETLHARKVPSMAEK